MATITDIAGATVAFKRVATAIRELQVAKQGAAATKTVEALSAATTAQSKLDEALRGLPEPIAARVRKMAEVPEATILNPDSPLATVGEAGGMAGRKGFGVFDAVIPGIPPPAVVKVFPANDPGMLAAFKTELAGAKAAEKTGIGPRFVREVDVGPGKKAFAMEKISGYRPDTHLEELEEAAEAGKPGAAEKLDKATTLRDFVRSRIWQGTIDDFKAYVDALRKQNPPKYVRGVVQGFVDPQTGRWRPIDLGNVREMPEPGKPIAGETYEMAVRMHDDAVKEYVAKLTEMAPKPLPSQPPLPSFVPDE